jgi:diguanylate cyclase (GGDEF)-like protein/PAS domain S-box-containing protein
MRPSALPRRALLGALLLFVGGMLAITAYTLWRLHTEAVANGREIAAMHSRSFEDFLTQSLHVTELVAANAVPSDGATADLRSTEHTFAATLRQAPYLRSISLLDERDRIVASSNPANVGITVTTQSYLPAATGSVEILRIGQPWAGRDFAAARPATHQDPVEADSSSFIPVIHTVVGRERAVTLLFALNPDYFLNHISQTFDTKQGGVEVRRYDGTLLMSTDPGRHPGSLHHEGVPDLRLADVESGEFEQDFGDGHPSLNAFRASRLYPFVVITQIDREHTLRNWRVEAKTLLGVVVPALLAITLLAVAFYRRQLQIAVQRAETERLERINATVFSASTEAILITDQNANIISVNPAFTDITGYGPEDVVGRNPRLLSSGRHDKSFYEGIWRAIQEKGAWKGELINRHKNGSFYDAQLSITVSHDADGRVQHYIGDISDITERKQAQEKLRLAASVFTHSREGIMITAADGTILDVNDAFGSITGYSRDDVLGHNPRLLGSGRQGQAFYADLWRSLIEKTHWYGEIWNRRKNGEVYAEMLTISAVRDVQGITRQYVALFSDITTLKEHQRQLEHVAHYDALTTLPNRVLLADRLQHGIAQIQRRGQRLAVAYLDLDGFKSINDSHGHEVGDQLLIAVSTRMKQALREGDTLARIGGDEFVAVLLDLDDVAASAPILNRLLVAAAETVYLDNIVVQVSASLGVTFYPQAQDIDADQLLRQADQAMYQAKLAGKNRYHIFDAEQDHNVRGRHESLEQIRRALREGEFVLYYQPKVNMRTGTVIGAEALIRWQHPQQGLLPPAAFLPVIEDHPLAVELGEWVIGSALSQMAQWRAAGLHIPVSVNVGARQLQQADFITSLRATLALYPTVEPGDLELEVLETSALEDLTRVSQVIDACKEIGIRFAMDDFGTGYSSLTYLRRLPVTLLKIDQSFVRGMLDDPDDLAILVGVLALASAFRRQTLAEGVETLAHGELLLQLGCDLAQGYGIAHPMPAHELPGWSMAWRPDPTWADVSRVSRDDYSLLFAIVEHRAWMADIESFLTGRRDTPPPLDTEGCRFGIWLKEQGLTQHAAQPALTELDALHRQLHALGAQLHDLQVQGRSFDVLARLAELHELQDALLGQLTALVRGSR